MPVNRGQVSQSTSLPAPVGGWNARDSLANMDPNDAVYLDNWFPRNDRVEVRGAFGAWNSCTSVTGDIETLGVWNGGSSSKLWAFGVISSAVKAFDVTAGGGTAAAANAAFTTLAHTGANAQYSQAMFNNVAGFYLYLCDENGVNAPCHYNGTTWAAPSLTGTNAAGAALVTTNLVHVNLFKFRLFFVEKNTLDFWYLPMDAIAGTLKQFRMGGYFNEGGSILATGTWTVDAGDGVNDRFVVVTTEGQVAIFEGDDISSASSWSLIGVFKTARPIGRRCMFRDGADLYLITTDGLYSLTSILGQDATNPAKTITDKVRLAFQQSARSYSSTFGWQAMYYPKGRFVLCNVPQGTGAGSVTHQYVMNAETKAWCRFKDQPARCWAVMGGNLYFGAAAGLVRQADSTTVTTDAGSAITAAAKQAYNYFGTRGQEKFFTMMRPSMQTNAASIALLIGLDVDFRSSSTPTSSATVGVTGATWDVDPWDTTSWSVEDAVNAAWATAGGIGHCAAFLLGVSVSSAGVAWYATDYVYQNGGVL